MNENNRAGQNWRARSVPQTTSEVEAAVVRALEQGPAVNVPDAFAARVTERAFAQGAPRPARRPQLGPLAALVCGAVLLLVLFVFAPHATPSFGNMRFDLELVALAELGLVGFVLSRAGLRE